MDDLSLSLTYEQKKAYIESNNPNKKVYTYLKEKLDSLNINVGGVAQGLIIDLMLKDHLVGWCWESTESAIVFFNDYDTIERGYLYLDDDNYQYYHSWIRFKYEGLEYIFDPSLAIVGRTKDYIEVFKPKLEGQVSAKLVRAELIKQINDYVPEKKVETYIDKMHKLLNINFSSDYLNYVKEKEKEAKITNIRDNPNDPLFRNTAGYKAEIDGNIISKVDAHYYNYKWH